MSLLRLPRAYLHHSTSTPACALILHRPLATTAGSPLKSNQSSSSPPVDYQRLPHLKRPSRGGQDLSHRYQRLGRSLRGKTVYSQEVQYLERGEALTEPAPYTSEEVTQTASTSSRKDTRRIFRGFVVPEAPKPPAEDECCMSGCAICVYDLYDEARNDYIQALDHLRSNLVELNVPEAEWPADVRRDSQTAPTSPASRPNATLSAFEQLEQALKAKKEKATQAGLTSHTGDAPNRSEVAAEPSPVVRNRPPKKKPGMNDVYEGLRWVLFSNR